MGCDFDNTLVFTEELKSDIFAKIIKEEWDINFDLAKEHWPKFVGRRNIFDSIYKQKFHKNLSDKEFKRVNDKFTEIISVEYKNCELVPNILDFLKFCSNKFDFFFVCSGVPNNELKQALKIKNIYKYFDYIQGTTKMYRNKEDILNKILNMCKPKLAFFLGDHPIDMKAASKVKMIGIGLLTTNSSEDLLRAGATYTTTPDKILSLIKDLLKKELKF